MNLRRWDRIIVAIGDEFHTAIVQRVGSGGKKRPVVCELRIDTSGGRAFSNFGPIFYTAHKYTVRRRDEGLTWVRANDPAAIEAMKAARALR